MRSFAAGRRRLLGSTEVFGWTLHQSSYSVGVFSGTGGAPNLTPLISPTWDADGYVEFNGAQRLNAAAVNLTGKTAVSLQAKQTAWNQATPYAVSLPGAWLAGRWFYATTEAGANAVILNDSLPTPLRDITINATTHLFAVSGVGSAAIVGPTLGSGAVCIGNRIQSEIGRFWIGSIRNIVVT